MGSHRTRTVWLVAGLLGCLFFAGPGVGAEARGLDDELEARLTVTKLLPHWVHADASHSVARNGHIDFYRFWVSDEVTGQIVRAPKRTDGGHYYVALPNGRYRVSAQVTGTTGATATTSSIVDVVNSTTVLSTTTGQTTAQCSTSGTIVTCTLSTDNGTDTIDLADLAAQAGATENNVMWFQAWGVRGGNGRRTASPAAPMVARAAMP